MKDHPSSKHSGEHKHKHKEAGATSPCVPEEKPEGQEAAPIEASPPPIVSMETEAKSLKDQLLRLQADFDNYRKRVLRDQADTALRAQENLMREMLPVLDHFEFGLKNARENNIPEAVQNGFQLVHDQLLAALSKFGLSTIEAAGAMFDPHLHEAVTHLPSPDKPVDAVLLQTRRGYKLGDRLLRAAQVVVSRGAADTQTESGGDELNHEEER